MKSKWQGLWNNRGIKYKNKPLRIIDGYDSGTGKITNRAFADLVYMIKSKLDLKPRDRLLEIGCGAGAILAELAKTCKNIYGIDYAPSLIKIAKKEMPFGKFRVSEASNIPFNGPFNKILCFGVFIYFPDYNYAYRVLNEMERCLGDKGRILIGEISDLNSEKEFKKIRKKNPHSKDYEDQQLKHLYFKQSFFNDFFKGRGMKCSIFSHKLKGYENSRFRFNVLAEK